MRERKRNLNQRLNVTFVFSPHEQASDTQVLEKVLNERKKISQNQLVICPELRGATPKTVQQIEDTNKYPPLNFPEFTSKMNELLAEHEPRFVLLERLSAEDATKEMEVIKAISNNMNQAAGNFFWGKHEDALKHVKIGMNIEGKANADREKKIRRNLSELGEKIIEVHPDLAGEEEIDVIIPYGLAHSLLSKDSKKFGFKKVERKMLKPVYFEPYTVFMRKKEQIIKENENEDTQMARSLIGLLAYHHVRRLGVNYANAGAFSNIISKKISLKQFKKMSEYSSQNTPFGFEKPNELIENFSQAGIEIPRTKEEIYAFLKKKGIRLAK